MQSPPQGSQSAPQPFPAQAGSLAQATGSGSGTHWPDAAQRPSREGARHPVARQGGSKTQASPQLLPWQLCAGGGGGPQVAGPAPQASWPSQTTGAGHGAPYGQGPSQATPQARPRQVSPSQRKVPAVTHWPRMLQAVGAAVGTGQVAGSVPAGQ
jgi:hypothetical protein